MSNQSVADPYVIYTEEGDKHIRKGKYVYMIYKNAKNILNSLKFKHKTVNDYNQHLCGGWYVYDHSEFEEVDRVAAGLKPVGISSTHDKLRAENKRKELSSRGLLATVYERIDNNPLYFVTASPRGTLGKFFKNLNILANDYRKHNLTYCANIIEQYRNINFIKFHDLKFDDYPTCITGLVLGYPIENTIFLLLRDQNNDDFFDFEVFNKQALDEDFEEEDDFQECNCDECNYEECNCDDCNYGECNCDECDYKECNLEEFNLNINSESSNNIDFKYHTVVPYDEEQGLYLDSNNFIVFKISSGKIGVIGKYIKEKNRVISLTSEEKNKAKTIGLIVDDLIEQESLYTDIWAID